MINLLISSFHREIFHSGRRQNATDFLQRSNLLAYGHSLSSNLPCNFPDDPSHILTRWGFKKLDFRAQTEFGQKVRLYHLKDLTCKKIENAQRAIVRECELGRIYTGDLEAFAREIQQKPYLVKEGDLLELVSEETVSQIQKVYRNSKEKEKDGSPHVSSVSKTCIDFQNQVDIGRDMRIQASVVYIGFAGITTDGSFVKTKQCDFSQSLISNCPLPPRDFTGRYDELKILHETCAQEKRVALCGLGGIGKTTLALKYAEDHKTSYQWIYFIRASNATRANQELHQLANKMGISKQLSQEERFTQLKMQLERHKTPFLLIFDGIDDVIILNAIKPYLPGKGNMLLLVTSRLRGQLDNMFRLMYLNVFDLEEAKDYLLNSVNLQKEIDRNSEQAVLLAKGLGRLPLALKHATAFIRNTPGYTFEKYLKEFTQEGVQLFEEENLDLEPEEQTILKTWNKSIDAINHHHKCPRAKEVLEFLSVLGSAPIPLDLVKKWFQETHPDLRPRQLDNALRHLQNYSLLESSSETCSIHLLVQKVNNYQLISEKQKILEQQALNACYESTRKLNVSSLEDRQKLRSFIPHFDTLKKHLIKDMSSQELISRFEFLLNLIWDCYDENSEYEQAQHIVHEIEDLRLRFFENDLSRQACNCSKQARSLKGLGKFKEALLHAMSALSIQECLLGKQHINTAKNHNLVGVLYCELFDYRRGLNHIGKAYELAEEFHKEDLNLIAEIRNNISRGMLWNNDFTKGSLAFCYENLNILTQMNRKEHLQTAQCYEDMGNIHIKLGETDKGLEMHQKALDLRKKLLGETHSDTILSYIAVGDALSRLKQSTEALQYLIYAEQLNKNVPIENPEILIHLYKILGIVYLELGQSEQSLRYLRLSSTLQIELIGERDPLVMQLYQKAKSSFWKSVEVMLELSNVLKTYGFRYILCIEGQELLIEDLEWRDTIFRCSHQESIMEFPIDLANNGHIRNSRPLSKYQQVLLDEPADITGLQAKIEELFQEEEHPVIAMKLTGIGLILKGVGENEEALKCFQKALKVRQSLFGSRHPDVIDSLEDVRMVLELLGRHEEALKYRIEALELKQSILGNRDSRIIIDIENMGCALGNLAKHEEALTYHMEALKLAKSSLGEQHPYVAISSNNPGGVLRTLGKHDDSLMYYRQALELTQLHLGQQNSYVATSLSNVGAALNDLKQHEEALTYHKKSLELCKFLHGEQHSSVITGLNTVGETLRALGRHDEALSHLQEAITISETILNSNYLSIFYENIANYLQELGKTKEAQTYREKTMFIKSK